MHTVIVSPAKKTITRYRFAVLFVCALCGFSLFAMISACSAVNITATITPAIPTSIKIKDPIFTKKRP